MPGYKARCKIQCFVNSQGPGDLEGQDRFRARGAENHKETRHLGKTLIIEVSVHPAGGLILCPSPGRASPSVGLDQGYKWQQIGTEETKAVFCELALA